MTTETTMQDALSHIETLLGDAPEHVRRRWAELQAYLDGRRSGDEGEIAAAAPYEDDLLKHMSVSAHTFQGGDRSIEITIKFPFEVKPWASGHANLDLKAAATNGTEDERMLSFYQQEDAERKRLYALIRSSVSPIAVDCLRRMLGRDLRQGRDGVRFGLRHAAWWEGGRIGPQPQPEDEPVTKPITMVDGIEPTIRS